MRRLTLHSLLPEGLKTSGVTLKSWVEQNAQQKGQERGKPPWGQEGTASGREVSFSPKLREDCNCWLNTFIRVRLQHLPCRDLDPGGPRTAEVEGSELTLASSAPLGEAEAAPWLHFREAVT